MEVCDALEDADMDRGRKNKQLVVHHEVGVDNEHNLPKGKSPHVTDGHQQKATRSTEKDTTTRLVDSQGRERRHAKLRKRRGRRPTNTTPARKDTFPCLLSVSLEPTLRPSGRQRSWIGLLRRNHCVLAETMPNATVGIRYSPVKSFGCHPSTRNRKHGGN